MGKKLTMKLLANELDNVRTRVAEVESSAEQALGRVADQRVRDFVGPEPVDDDTTERLLNALAVDKSRRRGDLDPVSHWLEAEQDIDLILRSLGLRP